MAKFNVGDEVIYKGRMDRKGTIYNIADSMYWLREPGVPYPHSFRLGIYLDPYIQLYSDFLDGIVTPTPTPTPTSYIRIVNGNLEMSGDKRVVYDQKMAFYTRTESDFSLITAETVTLVEMGIPFEEAKAYAEVHWAGYDPCTGVTCSNTCDGTSLYSRKCVNGQCVKDALIESNSPTCGYTPPPTPTPVTCNGGSPHYGNGGDLLNHYDGDSDGKVTSADALRAQNDGMTTEEVQFILAASAAGSINAKCPGCYTPAHIPKFSVGDRLCTDQDEITHWFPQPREITGVTSSSYMTEGLQVPFDWDQYLHICTGEEKCLGIYCPDKCDGTSLYSQKCVNGVCVNDDIIEANSPSCGYVPSDDEIYDEIDDETDDETDDDGTDDTTNVAAIYCEESGYEYKTITDDEGVQKEICVFPDESSCDAWEFLAGTCEYDEDKGIFGDLDTKWIIIAVIGIIILGLLT